METFRHIRENHLTEIKKLNIKIGKPPEPVKTKLFRKPGPRSRTRLVAHPVINLNPISDTDQVTGMEVDMNISDGSQQVEQMDFESAINSIQQFSEDQRN